MKPIKNRVFCKDCNRHKMLFENEKKANAFIKFNSQEIEAQSGFSPSRSYYCMFCNGFHVTSNKEYKNLKSKTELVLEQYRLDKMKREIAQRKNIEIKNLKAEALKIHLEKTERLIEHLEGNKDNINSDTYAQILNSAFAELDIASRIVGNKQRKKSAEDKLIILRNKLENTTK